MNKLNERLALIANLSVVAGIVFLAVELQRNTEAIEAQTRDSMTEKQMEYYGWIATNRDLADVFVRGNSGSEGMDPTSLMMYYNIAQGMLREYENSHYQYERGLFAGEDFEPRIQRWRSAMAGVGFREVWADVREGYSSTFRAEIDRIVAEAGN